MIYRAIGVMSGSSLDGLDLVFAEFSETGGRWTYTISAAECVPYPAEWVGRLQKATSLSAKDYLLLDVAYGQYIGTQINQFIEKNDLHHKPSLISVHGHTTFHEPLNHMTAQLGDGAVIASLTCLPVVCNLRSMDVALGGQGAPIVPIGEAFLFPGIPCFLNMGGIANISIFNDRHAMAFDVCAANQLLNALAKKAGKEFDENGKLASQGKVVDKLFVALNGADYFNWPPPKSLSNELSREVLLPLIDSFDIPVEDALRTVVAHICQQIERALLMQGKHLDVSKMLVTGGGALNVFLMYCLQQQLSKHSVEVVVPDLDVVQFKEALIMAFIGVKRWREEPNVFASATGAVRSGIGGAVYMGTLS